MSQLIVRQLEEAVVKELKKQADLHGISMEEEHRRILREALLGRAKKKQSFKKYLLSMPDAGSDEAFDRVPDFGRHVEL
jgi:antitoxin FitA